MRKIGAVAVVAALAFLAGADRCAAADGTSDSRLSLKLNFGVSAYPSDEDITGGPVTALGVSPDPYETKSVMIYHFDQKFGKELYGAVCWRANENVELELGFGYRDLQLEITQHNQYSCWVNTSGIPEYVTSAPEALDTKTDNDFSIITIRPGASFTMSKKSGIIPYLSGGLDVMIVQATTTLDFIRPYVTENPPGHFNLFAGTNGLQEDLVFDASQVILGLDIGTGLEFRASQLLSFTFGVSYLFQFGKAFSDFGSYVEDNPADPAIKDANYSFEGMNLTNVNFAIGVIARL
jgi:hypothetical protein